MNKILIAVPTFDGHIELETTIAIVEMCKEHDAVFFPVRGYDVASARNYAAHEAVNGGYTHLLFIDSDTVPPTNALTMLLERNHPVEVGAYVWCADYSKTIISRLEEPRGLIYDGERLISCSEVKELQGEELQIGGAGLGCALISTEVLKQLNAPWFRWVIYDNGEELGEDCYFAELCRMNNIPMYLDSRVLCGHIKPYKFEV